MSENQISIIIWLPPIMTAHVTHMNQWNGSMSHWDPLASSDSSTGASVLLVVHWKLNDSFFSGSFILLHLCNSFMSENKLNSIIPPPLIITAHVTHMNQWNGMWHIWTNEMSCDTYEPMKWHVTHMNQWNGSIWHVQFAYPVIMNEVYICLCITPFVS